jgi:hypothetical protein
VIRGSSVIRGSFVIRYSYYCHVPSAVESG